MTPLVSPFGCCSQVVNSARDKFVASARASGLAHMQEVGTKGCTVTVNEQTFLPPSPDQVASPDLPSCCGGIVALNGNGTISCASCVAFYVPGDPSAGCAGDIQCVCKKK